MCNGWDDRYTGVTPLVWKVERLLVVELCADALLAPKLANGQQSVRKTWDAPHVGKYNDYAFASARDKYHRHVADTLSVRDIAVSRTETLAARPHVDQVLAVIRHAARAARVDGSTP